MNATGAAAGRRAWATGEHYAILRDRDGTSTVLTGGRCPDCRKEVTRSYREGVGFRLIDAVTVHRGRVELVPHDCGGRG